MHQLYLTNEPVVFIERQKNTPYLHLNAAHPENFYDYRDHLKIYWVLTTTTKNVHFTFYQLHFKYVNRMFIVHWTNTTTLLHENYSW